MKCTVVRVKGTLFVRCDMSLNSEPTMVSNFWPIDETCSRAAFRLVGYEVEDRGRDGRFSLSIRPALERLGDTIEYHQLKECVAALPQGGRTEASFQESTPIPPPRVRKGIEVRYQYGRWAFRDDPYYDDMRETALQSIADALQRQRQLGQIAAAALHALNWG